MVGVPPASCHTRRAWDDPAISKDASRGPGCGGYGSAAADRARARHRVARVFTIVARRTSPWPLYSNTAIAERYGVDEVILLDTHAELSSRRDMLIALADRCKLHELPR